MQVANERQINIEVQEMNNIKLCNNTKSNEFSKLTYIIITALAMTLIGFIYLQILI